MAGKEEKANMGKVESFSLHYLLILVLLRLADTAVKGV
jgi:hypothetical protein